MSKDDDNWLEIGRWTTPANAVNALIGWKLQSVGNWFGKIEELPSRSRASKTSYAVYVTPSPAPKPTLSALEAQYVVPVVQKNVSSPRGRRTSKRRR